MNTADKIAGNIADSAIFLAMLLVILPAILNKVLYGTAGEIKKNHMVINWKWKKRFHTIL